MKLTQIVLEANVADKILKDPKLPKQLAIAWRHDSSIPGNYKAKLGPNPKDEDIVRSWSELLDDTLRRNNYGDLSQDGKFDDWLTRLYINGAADYEDINGEGGDALGAWKALSLRGKLKPQDQDFNKFKNIKQLQRIRNDRDYRQELERIKDQEHIAKMKKEAKQVEIVDDERYSVIVPLNYGSCYSRDKSDGYIPNFCTSSSSGLRWFNNYAPSGMIINVVDKQNINDKDGKWQMHAVTNQLVNADQDYRGNLSRNDETFSQLFPGLMKKIVAGIQAKAEEIKQGSVSVTGGEGYDVNAEINLIKTKFPLSYASDVAEPEAPAQDDNDGPGRYLVTHTVSGRTARIEGESKEDVQQQLLARHPNINLNEFTFEKIREEEQ